MAAEQYEGADVTQETSQLPSNRVSTSVAFKRLIVDEDFRDYLAQQTNLRRAFHLATSLFHLRDWTHNEYSDQPSWKYGRKISEYQTYLETRCSDFGYLRDLANSVKHAKLGAGHRASTQMIGLANTNVIVRMSGGFDFGAFQENAFDRDLRTVILSETGPGQHVEFLPAAQSVMTMWDSLFAENGWA